MYENIIVVLDVISTIAFGVALLFALRIPRSIVDQPSKTFLGLCLGIYVFVGISNILQHGQITDYLDRYEDYFEIFFPLLFLFFIYSFITKQELNNRKQAEKALRKTLKEREELEHIVNYSPAVVFLWRAAEGWPIEFVSDNVQQFGYSPEDFYSGRIPFANIIHPDDLERVAKEVAQYSMEGRKIFVQEYRIVTKTGETRWLDDRTWVRRNSNGIITHYQGIALDITEHKQVEEKLKENELFLQDMFDAIQDGISVLDTDLTIRHVNRTMEEWYAKNLPLVGKKCYEAYHNRTTPCKPCPSLRCIKSGRLELEIVHGLPDSSVEWIELFSHPMKDSNSSDVTGVVEFVRNITKRKRAEEEKRMIEDQLRQAQKIEAVGRLAGGIAHDFNNILAAIMGYSNIMQMKMSEDNPLQVDVDQILGASHRAAQLTHSLLAFSRQQIIHPKPVNLNKIINSVGKLLLRLISEDIEFKTNLTDKDLTIMADSSQIEQVIMNLAINARDAMPEGGLLTISTELVELDKYFIKTYGYNVKPGMYSLICFTDTGEGMDENIRKRIFEPFFTTKELGRGTGLGLAIIYGIVKQHNGFVDVFSKPGKGTTFKIYLPVIKSAIEETKAETLSPPKGGAETVLVAEDNEVVREIVKTILDRFGYKVIEAVDGEDAVTRFKENKDKIDLVILDVIMPKKNGKKAYDEMKEVSPEIKAIFTSGYTTEIIDKKGILEEGINFIQKPVSANELLKKMREVLED